MNNNYSDFDSPVVSLIIPCYNQGKYLFKAIESGLNQTYHNLEIIVVDDGSVDITQEVAQRYPKVKYIYQENQGLSSARNTGIKNSVGSYLVFLDADDLLYFDSIEYRVKYLLNHQSLAFVSGAHIVETMDGQKISQKKEQVNDMHYLNFLKGNYIGMHATVMYRRFVFDEFHFDTSLKACEDYDIYFKISRKYPVAHLTKLLAIYRKHENNMSGNLGLMLDSAIRVLIKQKDQLSSKSEKLAYKVGINGFKKYYTKYVFDNLRIGTSQTTDENLKFLRKNNPALFFRHKILKKVKVTINNPLLKKIIPEFGFKILYKLGFNKSYSPPINKIDIGDLNRLVPFSKSFGYDRGGPIDRYYIEGFLQDSSEYIHGRVLEIGDNEYTLKYGKGNVQKSEILHVNEDNPNVTIVGDLSYAPQIEDNSYDCIILTQTLHLVYDFQSVIQTCYRILKPRGTLLMTIPGITPIDYGEWKDNWLWSFTGKAIGQILREAFLPDYITVETFGNVQVATAFLYGIGLPEMKKEVLDYNDPQMQVIITAKAIKEFKN